MKKSLLFLLIVATCFSIYACGDTQDTNSITSNTSNVSPEQSEESSQFEESLESEEISVENIVKYKLGDTANSKRAKFTLDEACFAIALNNTTANDAFFIPKEYDPEQDKRNPYVAELGHTLIAFTYSIKNLDRASFSWGGVCTVKYNEKTYNCGIEYGYEKDESNKWKYYDSSNILIFANEVSTYRCYVDLPIEVSDFSDTFELTFNLPTISDEDYKVTYIINE